MKKKPTVKSSKIDNTPVQGPQDLDVSPIAIGLLLTFLFCCIVYAFRSSVKSKPQPKKYIDSRGYVVLAETSELEHRAIAKDVMGRELNEDEVVHHINGRRTDNHLRNLCLMDKEKHEHHHAWLRWKKEKTGRYPSITQQKRALEEEYGGTLLENFEQNAPSDDNKSKFRFPPIKKSRRY